MVDKSEEDFRMEVGIGHFTNPCQVKHILSHRNGTALDTNDRPPTMMNEIIGCKKRAGRTELRIAVYVLGEIMGK